MIIYCTTEANEKALQTEVKRKKERNEMALQTEVKRKKERNEMALQTEVKRKKERNEMALHTLQKSYKEIYIRNSNLYKVDNDISSMPSKTKFTLIFIGFFMCCSFIAGVILYLINQEKFRTYIIILFIVWILLIGALVIGVVVNKSYNYNDPNLPQEIFQDFQQMCKKISNYEGHHVQLSPKHMGSLIQLCFLLKPRSLLSLCEFFNHITIMETKNTDPFILFFVDFFERYAKSCGIEVERQHIPNDGLTYIG